MLKFLKMKNVGPSLNPEINFSDRLNIFTGDNGLGKSFLLDIAWWALTSRWPVEVNSDLSFGFPATPAEKGPASIEFRIQTKSREYEFKRIFDRDTQTWKPSPDFGYFSPGFMDLVLYAQTDGSFSVWDPARNGWKHPDSDGSLGGIPAYVFNAREVWEGLRDSSGRLLCNGLISDWAGWQKEKGEAFEILCNVLCALSPEGELIEPGALTRISIEDPRDIPTIKMTYGVDVPLPKASAGMRRIVSMAYMLVWAWQEHYHASALRNRETVDRVTFLIDEIEAHLHPKWQRLIVRSLLEVNNRISKWPNVQLIVSTHSPMVMASLEQLFDSKIDSWFDIDYTYPGSAEKRLVDITNRNFEKHGDANQWLISEAFDLTYATSKEAEVVLNNAEEILASDAEIDISDIKNLDGDLRRVLGESDPFWITWNYMKLKKGWLR